MEIEKVPKGSDLSTIDPKLLEYAHKDDLFNWVSRMMTETPNEDTFWTADGDLRIYRRAHPNKKIIKPLFLASFPIAVTAEFADPLVNLAENRLAWDQFVTKFFELNPNNGSDEDEVFSMIEVTKRYILERRIRRVMSDGARVCVCTSHTARPGQELPPHEGYTEAWNFTNGVAIIPHPTDPKKCIVRMLACSEPGGWMAGRITGWLIDKMVPGGLKKVCNSLRTFVSNMDEKAKKEADKKEKKKDKK